MSFRIIEFIRDLLIMGGILTALGILYILLHAAVQWTYGWIGDLIFVVILLVLLKLTFRLFVFPGSFSLFHLGIQHQYATDMASTAKSGLQTLQLMLQKLKHLVPEEKISEKQIQSLNQILKSYTWVFGQLEQKQLLNPKQKQLSQLFTSLNTNLNKIEIYNTKFTLLLNKSPLIVSLFDLNRFKPIDDEIYQACTKIVTDIEFILGQICHCSRLRRIINFFREQTLATGDMMRCMLEGQGEGTHQMLPSFDGKLIDCLFLNTTQKKESPIVFYCQANASYYEYLFWTDKWIQIYKQMGYNIFLWNYRGYANSQGSSNTNDILKDAEYIFDHLVSTYNVEMIVHGHSLGGLVASHLGRYRKFQTLIVDRSFASFSLIADLWIFRGFGFFLKYFTGWNYDVCDAYSRCQNSRILTTDYGDEVVPFPATLQCAVDRQSFKNQMQFHQMGDKLSEQKLIYRLLKFCNKKQSFFSSWYSLILNEREMKQLFQSIQRVIKIIKSLKIQHKPIQMDLVTLSLELQKLDESEQQLIPTPLIDYQTTKQMTQVFTFDQDQEYLKVFLELVQDNFEYIEGAHLTLNSLFKKIPQKYQFSALHDLILAIFQRGSYIPMSNIITEKINRIKALQVAQDKLTIGLTKLDKLIEQQQYKFSDQYIYIINDIKTIIVKLEKIRNSFKRIGKGALSKEIELTEPLQFLSEESTIRQNTLTQLGYLLPLQCGHNGNYSEIELEYLKFYLSK